MNLLTQAEVIKANNCRVGQLNRNLTELSTGLHSIEEVFSRAGVIDKKYFTCQVCGKAFKDGWEHSFTKSRRTPFLVWKDKKHREYGQAVEKAGFDERGICNEKCFCGGTIRMTGVGEEGWETTCNNCGFLWDED